jgi:formylglycine-generating enzyme required for sulfatase activity
MGEKEKEDETSMRVLRGGSFDNDHRVARCAYRSRGVPSNRYDYLGFRVVVSPILKSVL